MPEQLTPRSTAKQLANKFLKVALSVLLVVGFLPMVEQEAVAAETAEGNVKIVEIFPSYGHQVYALSDVGDLYLWGYDMSGDGVLTTPVKVLEDVKTACVPEEGGAAYAIKADGSLYAWGSSTYGQVGDGQTGWRNSPVKVLDNVKSVQSHGATVFALTEDGILYGWGCNQDGQVGIGSTTFGCYEPTMVMSDVETFSCYGITNFTRVFAIRTDGSLYAWGYNKHGMLGDGGSVNLTVPTKILEGVASVCQKEGETNGYTSTLAIMEDGSLYAWGYNNQGQVGIGSANMYGDSYAPTKILEDVVAAYPHGEANYALTSDGLLYVCGGTPNGTGSDQLTPVKILEGVASKVAGAFALGKDDALYGWGHGGVPVKVMDGVDSVLTWGDTFALSLDGVLYKLTSGSDGSYSSVEFMDDVSFACEYAYYGVMAVKNDGSLWAWGDNSYGQLGDAGESDGSEPVRVVFPGDVVEGSGSGTDAPTSSPTIETEALIRAEETGAGSVAYPLTWDDDWFLAQDGGEYEYNPDLAEAACVLAASGYSNTAKNDHRHVKTTLRQVGFDPGSIVTDSYVGRIKPDGSGYADGIDKVAYAFASKEIPDGEGGWDTLVAVVVRGTPGNLEWVSNANVDNADETGGKNHEGFAAASAEMIAALNAYMSERGIDRDEAKYLLTGHSRGAAVANLAAASLDLTYDARSVYAYCFATPRAENDPFSAWDSDLYDNIYNIVNPEDFVPRLPLAKWGYQRYGKTYYLPCKSTQKELWKDLIGSVRNGYESYFSQSYKGFGGAAKTDALVSKAYSLAPSVSAAYGNTEGSHHTYMGFWSMPFIDYFTTMMLYLSYRNWEDFKDKASEYKKDLVKYSIGEYFGVFQYFLCYNVLPGAGNSAVDTLNEKVLNKILKGELDPANIEFDDKVFGAHSEKTYLLWMGALNDAGVTPIQAGEKCDTGRMTMYCPVDVTVYDPDGNVVARIVDDVLDEELAESDEGLAAYVDPDTGAKSVWVPLGQGYRVETVATDSGTLDVTWSVSEPEGDVVEQEARVDLPLQEGTVYTATVSDQGTEGAFEDSVSFVDEDGEEIQPDFTADAETAGSLAVSVSAAEGGSASGNAEATAGDHVTVNATALPGYLFDGWYEGEELVSSEAAWTFRAEASRALEARFVACEHPNGNNPCQDCGYCEFELSDCELSLEYEQTVYDGTYQKPKMTLSYNGLELTEGQDYTLSYSNNRRAGTATVTATAEGGQAYGTVGTAILPGSVSADFRISRASMGDCGEVFLPAASFAYNGKARKPVPTVRVCGVKQLNTQYDITYRNASKKAKVAPKNVGAYWVRVKAKATANATGTVWVKFTIKPKATANLRLARLNNGFKATWAKRTAQVSGYQVQYRLKGKAAWNSKWVKGCKTNFRKVTGLKDKKTYQVRVRTYKTVNGVKYYSAWTPIKAVKTK